MINYVPQINVNKILKYSQKRVLAGEDGFIKIRDIKNNISSYNLGNISGSKENKIMKSFRETENILESMTGNDDFLASIEDVDEFVNGDIIACTSDGDFGLYNFNTKENNYTLKKLDIKIKDDCIYNIETLETKIEKRRTKKRSFECWGEKGVIYTFEV